MLARKTYIDAEEDCDDNLGSFPLSTWSQDCGFKALGCVSLHDSAVKKVLIGHKRQNKSQISTIIAVYASSSKSNLYKLEPKKRSRPTKREKREASTCRSHSTTLNSKIPNPRKKKHLFSFFLSSFNCSPFRSNRTNNLKVTVFPKKNDHTH